MRLMHSRFASGKQYSMSLSILRDGYHRGRMLTGGGGGGGGMGGGMLVIK